MKLVTTTILSWLAGVAAHLLLTWRLFKEPLNGDDFIGIGVLSLVASILVFFLLYTPGLLWLRRRLGGCKPAIYFPLWAALPLNLPVFLLIGLLYQYAGAFSAGEAMLFACQFMVAGAAFGAGFVWHFQKPPFPKTAPAIQP
jgi:hypothetical protein